MHWLILLSIYASMATCWTLPANTKGHSQLLQRPTDESDCFFQWFTQRIDHFGHHNGTFQQRYNLITKFYKPGGPILFFQGEESTVLDCVDSTIFYSFAQELNGIAVSLEHRYFGNSKPLGASDPTTQPDKFEYLTLDNVMADAVNVVEALRNRIPGAKNAKAIVASGSYGGFLATVFRQNHPETFYGAIASAPPVESLGDVTNFSKWSWGTWVNNVYQDRSFGASTKIQAAFRALQERFHTGNVTGLKQELGLCHEPTTSITDLELLQIWIQSVYSNSAEFNYAALRPGRASASLPLEKVINIALTQPDPIQVLNETLWMWFGPSPGAGLPCIDYTNSSALQAGVPLIENTIFIYLVCKYFPLTGSANMPNGTIFPAMDNSAAFLESCQTAYNITAPTQAQLQKRYHFTSADLRNSTRIIWSLAQYDMTSAVSPNQIGVNAPLFSTDRNVSRVLYTSNMAHREDLFAPDPSDRDTVVQARQIELESIKGWLGV